MNRALSIPEVQKLVCSHLALLDEDLDVHLCPTAMSDLAKLARTNKAFSEPALDELWMTQTMLSNVMSCMPGVWGARREDVKRPIRQSDLKRAIPYMRRVKFFLCAGREQPTYAIRLARELRALRLALGNACIFPNLRLLLISFENELVLREITALLSPCLKHLVLGTVSTNLAYTILPTITSACPLLVQVLVTLGVAPKPHQIACLSEFVSALPQQLELFNSEYLDSGALLSLAALPVLRELTLSHLDSKILAGMELIPSKFPALATLDILADAVCIAGFVSLLSCSPLDHLTIRIDPPPSYFSLERVYNAVGKLPTITSLEITFITTHTVGHAARQPVPFISSLSKLHNLTSLTLSPPVDRDFSNDNISTIAKSHPRLESLTLHRARGGPEDNPFSPPYPLITISALLVLAKGCPALEYLHLSINATRGYIYNSFQDRNTAAADALTRRRTRKKNLLKWNLGTSVMDPGSVASTELARLLTAVFPKLRVVYSNVERRYARGRSVKGKVKVEERDNRSQEPDEPGAVVAVGAEEMLSRWEEVQDMVDVSRSIRMEEAEWVKAGHGFVDVDEEESE
ncbi:hypothetical protein C8F01DRAFT_1231025 [Mycena amicta]|nr:hypothetical protein C8F01DRAFT_1231025 [Mycena amicta]